MSGGRSPPPLQEMVAQLWLPQTRPRWRACARETRLFMAESNSSDAISEVGDCGAIHAKMRAHKLEKSVIERSRALFSYSSPRLRT